MKEISHRKRATASLFNRNHVYNILILLLFSPLLYAQGIPVRNYFEPGETLNYDVYFKWGMLMPRAGIASISLNESEYQGKPTINYKLLFKTTGIFDKIYKMRDTIECQFSQEMILLNSEKRTNENNYYAIDRLSFNYDEDQTSVHSLRYTPSRVKIDTVMVSIDDNLFDLLASALFLRSIDWNNLKVGDEIPCAIAMGRSQIPVRFKYDGQQIIEPNQNTKYKTRHFWIDVVDEAFETSTNAAEIWVGDDENHIPIKARAKLKIGAAEIYFNSASGLRYPLSSQVVIPQQ